MVGTTSSGEIADVQVIGPEAGEAGDILPAYRILGGARTLGKPVRSSIEAHDLIAAGIPSRALVYLVGTVSILASHEAFTKVIGISPRSLQRKARLKNGQDRLPAWLGSRAWRFAEILSQATKVLGDQKAAEAWMLAPALGLDHRRPIELMASMVGATAVENHLIRLDYGVYT